MVCHVSQATARRCIFFSFFIYSKSRLRSIRPFCTSPFPKAEDGMEDEEAMFALKMRHSYVAVSRENEAPFNGSSGGATMPLAMAESQAPNSIFRAERARVPRANKVDQHVRMRKLRPRQTLCSNCQNRCDDAVGTKSSVVGGGAQSIVASATARSGTSATKAAGPVLPLVSVVRSVAQVCPAVASTSSQRALQQTQRFCDQQNASSAVAYHSPRPTSGFCGASETSAVSHFSSNKVAAKNSGVVVAGLGGGGESPAPPVPTQTSPSPWTVEETTPPHHHHCGDGASVANVYASVAEDAFIKEQLPCSAQVPEPACEQPHNGQSSECVFIQSRKPMQRLQHQSQQRQSSRVRQIDSSDVLPVDPITPAGTSAVLTGSVKSKAVATSVLKASLRSRRSASAAVDPSKIPAGLSAESAESRKRVTRSDIKVVGAASSLRQKRQFEQPKTATRSSTPTPQQSPVIKISFNNPQGKGTVVKIPAKVTLKRYEETTSDEDDNLKEPHQALRLLPKEPSSFGREADNTLGLRLPLDALPMKSPRRISDLPEDYQHLRSSLPTGTKHHKHKTGKHKRKRHKSSAIASSAEFSDGEDEGNVPDFPQAALESAASDMNHPDLKSRHELDSAQLSVCGGQAEALRSGDVVWGKVMGFPWWPGKILSLGSFEDDAISGGSLVNPSATLLRRGEAHVAWFGSSTSSRIAISSLAPFLRDFKLRYNRRKRGPYKEAIRQASLEARANAAAEAASST